MKLSHRTGPDPQIVPTSVSNSTYLLHCTAVCCPKHTIILRTSQHLPRPPGYSTYSHLLSTVQLHSTPDLVTSQLQLIIPYLPTRTVVSLRLALEAIPSLARSESGQSQRALQQSVPLELYDCLLALPYHSPVDNLVSQSRKASHHFCDRVESDHFITRQVPATRCELVPGLGEAEVPLSIKPFLLVADQKRRRPPHPFRGDPLTNRPLAANICSQFLRRLTDLFRLHQTFVF